jgi:hypothetical protein
MFPQSTRKISNFNMFKDKGNEMVSLHTPCSETLL